MITLLPIFAAIAVSRATNSGAANTMRVPRMGERVLDQRVLREQADRRHDVAAVHRAEEHAGGGDAVRQHVRDDLAWRDAVRRELRRETRARCSRSAP